MANPNTREGVDTYYHTLKYLADIDYIRLAISR